MERLQVGIRRGKVGEGGTGSVGQTQSALFRAYWMELILQHETVSVLSNHE
jgi:hypothetical protein